MSTWFLCQGKGISYNITTNISPIFTDFYTSNIDKEKGGDDL